MRSGHLKVTVINVTLTCVNYWLIKYVPNGLCVFCWCVCVCVRERKEGRKSEWSR